MPVRVARTNASAERFVRTIRLERLAWIVIVNRRRLETVVGGFVERYDSHRPHWPLGQTAALPTGTARTPTDSEAPSRLRWTDRLGGLVHEYRLTE